MPCQSYGSSRENSLISKGGKLCNIEKIHNLRTETISSGPLTSRLDGSYLKGLEDKIVIRSGEFEWTYNLLGESIVSTLDSAGNNIMFGIPCSNTTAIRLNSFVEVDSVGIVEQVYEGDIPSVAFKRPKGYISKYDSSGKIIWAAWLQSSFDTSLSDDFRLHDIVTDSDNNIYITGLAKFGITINEFVSVGGGVLTTSTYQHTLNIPTNSHEYQQFIIKFSPEGKLVWGNNITTDIPSIRNVVAKIKIIGDSIFIKNANAGNFVTINSFDTNTTNLVQLKTEGNLIGAVISLYC